MKTRCPSLNPINPADRCQLPEDHVSWKPPAQHRGKRRGRPWTWQHSPDLVSDDDPNRWEETPDAK